MFLLIDTIVLGVVVALVRAGWRRGFTHLAIDVGGFGLAVWAAVRLNPWAKVVFDWAMSPGWSAFAAGLLVFVPIIVVVALVGWRAGRFVLAPGLRMTDRVAGIGLGLAIAAGGLATLLIVSQTAPVPGGLADAVRRSSTASALLRLTSPVTGPISDALSPSADRIVLGLRRALESDPPPGRTVLPPQATPMPIDPARADELRPAPEAERELLALVNEARREAGLGLVTWDERLADVGRAHSRDMYVNGYFGHTSADGRSASDRIRQAGIRFRATGENLALAPSVALAHEGLMNSPGHRANILDAAFERLGIGIWDGPSGLMVSQEFCGGC